MNEEKRCPSYLMKRSLESNLGPLKCKIDMRKMYMTIMFLSNTKRVLNLNEYYAHVYSI